ncbi:hypothetical protein FNF28_06434 [Cafeteria roenbergensis]|uniref:Uncharacterized protein n=1 Tax=Cafeteria roenbergensis TaxID=33653 RepID=A0A5A8D217_CAFRO|nr:hypothetical protein FNF28_06434 [Cafeteria roenbergensis]
MADAKRRPSEAEADASKEAHEERYRSLGTGSGTWLDGVARNVGLPDSMQKHVDESTFNRTVRGRIVGEAEQAEYRAKMKRWGYTAAAVMTVGSIKGQEEELAALQTRWQELRTRHYERHPFLYRDD